MNNARFPSPLLLLLLLSLTPSLIDAACECKDHGPDAIGNCSVKEKVCGCLHHVTEWKYKATATEEHSGKSADAEWYSGADSAGEHSVVNLFNGPLGPHTCNCENFTYPLTANCTVRFDVCFMFNDTNALDHKLVSYRAWATDVHTGNQGSVSSYNNAQQAGTAALEAMLAKYPDEKKACTPGSVESGGGADGRSGIFATMMKKVWGGEGRGGDGSWFAGMKV